MFEKRHRRRFLVRLFAGMRELIVKKVPAEGLCFTGCTIGFIVILKFDKICIMADILVPNYLFLSVR